MAAILIWGWKVPDWEETYYAYDEDDHEYESGVDIEEILPKNSSMTLECSRVSGHCPYNWVLGFKASKNIAENGNCVTLNNTIMFMHTVDEDGGRKVAEKYSIPISGDPRWYLLDRGDD